MFTYTCFILHVHFRGWWQNFSLPGSLEEDIHQDIKLICRLQALCPRMGQKPSEWAVLGLEPGHWGRLDGFSTIQTSRQPLKQPVVLSAPACA